MLLAQLLVVNRKFPITSCDQELSDHLTTVTANHKDHVIGPSRCPGKKTVKGMPGLGEKGLNIFCVYMTGLPKTPAHTSLPWIRYCVPPKLLND